MAGGVGKVNDLSRRCQVGGYMHWLTDCRYSVREFGERGEDRRNEKRLTD